jgi:hypothetical protein
MHSNYRTGGHWWYRNAFVLCAFLYIGALCLTPPFNKKTARDLYDKSLVYSILYSTANLFCFLAFVACFVALLLLLFFVCVSHFLFKFKKLHITNFVLSLCESGIGIISNSSIPFRASDSGFLVIDIFHCYLVFLSRLPFFLSDSAAGDCKTVVHGDGDGRK